jgi:hypothetical protein
MTLLKSKIQYKMKKMTVNGGVKIIQNLQYLTMKTDLLIEKRQISQIIHV